MGDSQEARANSLDTRQPQPSSRTRLRFPKQSRLRKKNDFDRVYQDHAYARGPLFNVLVASNQLDRSRLGLSVSRQVGTAVRRNRWKRLLRESFRLMQAQLPAGLDIVVIPHPKSLPPPLAQLMHAFQAMVRKAHMHLKPKRQSSPQRTASDSSRKQRQQKGKRR